MWLHPFFHSIATVALSTYYRLSRAGHEVEKGGPVLLVANHPNSLLDPALVIYAAQRPVHFLAKATLFDLRGIGWLVRGSGAIPVYRKADDPTQMERNKEMFAAVHRALADGQAVGLFPEGISHSAPSLAPLKTGAARIALGAAQLIGRDFPIVPIGLVFSDKGTFRSRAHVIVGERVDWRDLAHRGEDDAEAVRTLTQRIDAAIRAVTVNLEKWEDAPIVELAEAVYAAENGLRQDAVERIARLKQITGVLAKMREDGDSRWIALADDLHRHGRLLQWLGLTPRSLRLVPSTRGAIWWTLKRLPLIVAGLSGIWIVGAILFWIPYRATALVSAKSAAKGEDLESTAKVIGGFLVFAVWIALLSVGAGLTWGARWGIAAAVVLPVFALLTLLVHEKLAAARKQVRRFFVVARSEDAIAELRARQQDIARRLDELWRGR